MNRILVDIDDTIENLLETWVKYLNKKYNLNVDVLDCHDWDLAKLFPMLKPDDIYSALEDNELWKEVTPLPGAVKYLKKLQDEGFDIVLVTSSEYFNIRPKIDNVLNVYFSFIPLRNLVVTSRKQLVKGDVLVDDYIKNLEGGDYLKIMMTAQHNKNLSIPDDVYRVDNWEDCYNLLHKLLNTRSGFSRS